MNVGAHCYSVAGSPGVYIGDGWCLVVCAQDNDLLVARAGRETAHEFPVPLESEVQVAALVVRALRGAA